MDDLLSEFLTETSENLAVLDVELVQLEQNPNDPDLLGNIFRLFHTIKGTCGFLGLPRLESVAHAAENVLDKFRDADLEVTPDAVTLILESLDKIKDLVGILEETEEEPEGDDKDLIARLNALANGEGQPAPAPAAVESAEEPAPAAVEAVAVEETTPATPADAAAGDAEQASDDAAAPGGDNEELQALFDAARAEMIHYEAQADVEAADAASDQAIANEGDGAAADAAASAAAAGEVADAEAAEAPTAAKPPAAKAARDKSANEHKEPSVANQSIRVNVELLENLMTMVSELVLTRNQLLQLVRQQKDSDFTGPLQRLNHVVSELQEGVMKTRMQPIGNAWAKLPRIVRDLSQELGKKINLEMLGADTELDRQVLELIKDPLTHMVRNSGDHGIETPDERRKAGKPEMGTIRLNAYHQGGHIVIEISDDGKGLNIEKIKAKVIENGLATEDELEGMTDQQIQQFIFKAGFSTAAKVTSVSGRGVGMDVVRTNIERIGGTAELTSQAGKGSTFLIKIPLTLAIVSALIVECASERFAIPQISVVELVRAGGSQSEHSVERLNGTPVLRLRERLLPLVSLRQQLKLKGDAKTEIVDGEEAVDEWSEDEDAFIVVTQVGNYTFGIIVDRVFDTEEIVVKPVAPIIRNVTLFSGNTILGDGSVIMILDPNGIATETGEMSVGDNVEDEIDSSIGRSSEDQVALLLFNAGDGAPKAVPLALVARLEDVEVGDMEVSNEGIVVQYRGQLMPLIPYDDSFDVEAAKAKAEQAEGRRSFPVLVFADGPRQMGLIVDEIVDIVEQAMQVDLAGEDKGILGSAIIADRATDVVDAGHYLTMAFQDWFSADPETFDDGQRREVLLVDDSPFFRNMITPMLGIAGFEVTTVASADEAMKLCEQGKMFDVIVSDIEMPGTTGFQFAEMVQASSAWANTPIVALSAHATPSHIERGRDVGFADYVSKSDRDAIVMALTETMSDLKGAA